VQGNITMKGHQSRAALASIWQATRGLVLFGTPHRSISPDTFGHTAESIAHRVLRDPRPSNTLLTSLRD
jgi:hypothetical protein